jgi:diaminopimelate epimerase
VGLISKLCDRHFGIGADGLLLLRNKENFDFEMVYYNADGSPATFCGNGGRSIVAFANQIGLIDKECLFLAPDGQHHASILSQLGNIWKVKLEMSDAIIYENSPEYTYLNSGTYHYVKLTDDPDSIDFIPFARKIRFDQRFAPDGTNVNLVKVAEDKLMVRTYEKGVEDETLSCGTGVTASAKLLH